MKKILTVLLALLIMLSLTAITVFASGEELGADVSAPSDDSITEEENGVAQGVTPSEGGDTETAEGDSAWADEIYAIAAENADKIFALLACLSSLIVGFAYKKGLLPLVKNALNALGNGVVSLKESSEKAEELTRDALDEAAKRLTRAEECFDLIREKLSALEKELSAAKESSVKDGELRLIMNSQIDMLYEIFMSSSLPSYQKDAVGERVAEMKRALAAETESE